jgi:prepilin-type N-terminal cleavage/methylation domain-containing protein
MYRVMRSDKGFTIVELLISVLIIGILVAIAIPIFGAVKSLAQRRTCYANQRTLEGTATTWVSLANGRDLASLIGVVNGAHPVVRAHIVRRGPTCPAFPKPADINNPTAAEGAYSFLAGGRVADCPEHGHY